MTVREDVLSVMPIGVWMNTAEIRDRCGHDCSKIHFILSGECRWKCAEKGDMVRIPGCTAPVATWRRLG